ncbi:hypothetical protein PROPEN_02169 [Proteus penneri ATCC 35198]|nr:hypothetical protein PROPEN_02169 [Proteus penneri ATCC 35198]
MNNIAKNHLPLHPSIIDGLIYFSKENKNSLKKRAAYSFFR